MSEVKCPVCGTTDWGAPVYLCGTCTREGTSKLVMRMPPEPREGLKGALMRIATMQEWCSQDEAPFMAIQIAREALRGEE